MTTTFKPIKVFDVEAKLFPYTSNVNRLSSNSHVICTSNWYITENEDTIKPGSYNVKYYIEDIIMNIRDPTKDDQKLYANCTMVFDAIVYRDEYDNITAARHEHIIIKGIKHNGKFYSYHGKDILNIVFEINKQLRKLEI